MRTVKPPLPNYALWGAIALLLLAFWVGLHYLDWKPIWGDERASIQSSGGMFYGPWSPLEIWNYVQTNNPWHTPGYYLILSAWGSLVNWAIPALRVLSLLMGVLTLAWTYRLGADIRGARAGLFALAVLGASAFLLHYFIQIRMYAFITLFSAFTLWVYMRLIRSKAEPRWWMWAGLLAGSVALLYMHYFASILLGGIGLYHLLFVRKTRRWLTVLGVFAFAALLFLPWAGGLAAGLSRAASFTALQQRALAPGEALIRLGYFFGNGSLLLALAALLVATVPLFVSRRISRWVGYIWFVTFAFLGLVLAGNALAKVMHEDRLRYLIGMWPLLAIMVGIGLDQLSRWPHTRWLPPVGLLLWVAFAGYQVAQRWSNIEIDSFQTYYPMQQIARALDDHVSYEDLIINGITVETLPDTDSPINEYRLMRPYYFPFDVATIMLQVPADPAQERVAQQEALSAIGEHPRFWFAYQPTNPPPLLNEMQTALAERYTLCRRVVDDPSLAVDLYTAAPVCCDNYDGDETPLATFGDGIRLTGLSALAVEGDMLPVVASWAIDDSVPLHTYSAGLYLFDADGNLASQVDYGLELPAVTCERAELPVGDLTPGRYDVRVAIYGWETGERLPGVVSRTSQADNLLTITSIELPPE